MSNDVTRAVKIKLICDTTQPLRAIENIRKALDKVTAQKLNTNTENKALSDIGKQAKKAQKQVEELSKAVRQAKRDLDKALNSNRTDIKYTTTDDYKQKAKAYTDLLNKQKEYQCLIKELNKSGNTKNTVNSSITQFVNYQRELSKLETQAAKVFRKLNSPDLDNGSKDKLGKQLERLKNQYANLNKEAVRFRKTLGVNHSRGFYDLNHNLDYFLAKFRSRLNYSLAMGAEDMLFSAIPNLVNQLSNYQQNKVNFAQVMPDNIANNQQAINLAMKEFTQIASDYGTATQDVIEAGRLWGRQYKDIATVQALVNNSTKLSITDNMSLVEVNKALEATMQQYKIQLKDVNEAQAVSGKIVDSWAKLADNAVVTASDLAKANEQSAGAAHQAGISFDYLQAMIATMSGATGKAGGEIGRSIRSMLVSMQGNKAQKYFRELGIATTELDVNGVPHVRSYEKVITDLMKKLQTTPKDVSKVVLAMSSGKFQYNNVMALLKNYEQLQKNLEITRTSKGWADEQVALQYETISRQVKALNADLQQLVITLDETGASNGIVNLIKVLRSVVQTLGNIDPAIIKISGIGVSTMLAMKTASSALVLFNNKLADIRQGMNTATGAFANMNSGVVKSKQSLAVFATATLSTVGSIIGLISVLTLLYGAFDAIYRQQNKNKLANTEYESVQNAQKAYKDFIAVYNEYQKVISDEVTSTDERTKAKERYTQACNALRDIVGDEAYARIIASNDIKSAVESEIQVLNQRQAAVSKNAKLYIQTQLEETDTAKQEVWQRIQYYRQEIKELASILQARVDTYNSYMQSDKPRWQKNFIHTTMFAGIEQDRLELERLNKLLADDLNEYNEQAKKRDELKAKLAEHDSIVDILGSTGGITDTEKPSANTNTDNTNYVEQAKRSKYQNEVNRLVNEGTLLNKAYQNSLQDITVLENNYGKTIESVTAKQAVYKEHSKTLSEYESKLEQTKKRLIAALDEQMKLNPEIAKQTEYNITAADNEKLANIEINRELYQQLKTYSGITEQLDKVNIKLADNRNNISDTTSKLLATRDELRKAVLDKEQYNIDLFKATADDNSLTYSQELANVQIKYQQVKMQLAQEMQAFIDSQIANLKPDNDNYALELAELKHAKQQEVLIYAQAMQEIKNLEYQKNLNIRQGLADITTSFLIEGNSLKDIWKKLWQDLAKEAIMRLFQIKTTSSFLGSLIGGFGGSSGSSAWNFGGSNFVSGGLFSNHTGTDVTRNPMEFGFRKMHTGGMVEQGRVGVVPKLRNDEVVRTLQVGEEVNSIQDRRSNEILASVAMKAMDAKNQQPTNVNIMALDSRSFAEYLNDNADILLGVLAKQGAMGRRV